MGGSPSGGSPAFAGFAGQPVAAVRALLLDTSRAVLGRCRAVTDNGQADPPDNGCWQGSLVVCEERATEWQLSGTLIALSPMLNGAAGASRAVS